MTASTKDATDVFDYAAFIADIEAYRIRRGYSQTEFAALCEMGTTTYKRILTGVYKPGLKACCLLADFADISLDKYRRVSV